MCARNVVVPCVTVKAGSIGGIEWLNRILVVGDVHGCYYTFRSLIAQYWRLPQDEILVQLGDLIDRGNYSPECAATARFFPSMNLTLSRSRHLSLY
jgi:hypothetical protein